MKIIMIIIVFSSLMLLGNFSIDESSQAFGRPLWNSFNLNSDTASYYGIIIPWNNDGIGASDDGDPLLFSLTDKPVNVIRNWPEQHESFLTEFDLYDIGKKVTLSRTLDDGTITLFLDLDGNGELSDGTEWLFDQNEDVYQIFENPLVDSNQNGWFDYQDNLWSIAMIKDGNEYYSSSELGILGFNWSMAEHYENDFVGKGRYSDCLWEGDPMIHLYPDCNPVSTGHFRITAYNADGILLKGGKIIPTFGGVMGHLDMDQNNTPLLQ